MKLPNLYVVIDTYGGVPVVKPFTSRFEAEATVDRIMKLHSAFEKGSPSEQPRIITYRPASEGD